MITNIWHQIRLVRKFKKGTWVKTKHRGWIELTTYQAYLGYAFDPEYLKHEEWQLFLLFIYCVSKSF